LLNTNLTDLEEEGALPKRRQERGSTATEAQPASWAHQRVRDMEERVGQQRRNYLDTFLVNGEPIGDLTPETVLARADLHERDARFMRLMASGVPHGHRIREFVTPQEAQERWHMAQQPSPVAPEVQERLQQIRRMLTTGRTLKRHEYESAMARAEVLRRGEALTALDTLELDALARVMSEYEDEQR
jgi:hypothetical protein